MFRKSYRGKRRAGASPSLFIYLGLVCLVAAFAIYLFSPPTRFVALVFAISGTFSIVYSALKYAVDNSFFPLATAVLLNIMRAVFLIAMASFIVVQMLIIAAHDTSDNAQDADYLIVLGAGVNGTEPSLSLQSRLIAARNYLDLNPDCIAVLSGGQGPGEDITEAECMRQYLLERNIAPERMILEQVSTDTIENVRNSLSLISADIGKSIEAYDSPLEVLSSSSIEAPPEFEIINAKIAVLSNEFHLFRAVTIGRNEGVTLEAVSAPSPRTDLLIAYHIREYFSVMKVFLTYLFI